MDTEVNVSNQVVWFDIPCKDLNRAIAWYSAVLGSTVVKEDYGEFSMGILPHSDSTVGGCLAVLQDTEPSDRGILIYLNCEGRLEEAVSLVEENGGTIRVPIHVIGPHGRRAIVIDSEGNRVALHTT